MPEFLVQMMASGDPDLSKVLGRRDIATARERAYAFAAAYPAAPEEPMADRRV